MTLSRLTRRWHHFDAPDMRKTPLLLCACLVALLVRLGSAQPQRQPQAPPQVVVIDREYEIKAKYLFFLPGFITPTAPEQPAADGQLPPLRIAIIGRSNAKLDETINSLKSQKLGKRNVEWKYFASPKDFEAQAASDWRVVFLLRLEGQAFDDAITKIDALTAGRSIILVTDQNDRFSKLASVNFYEDKTQNRIKMQVSQKKLEERKLNAAPNFLKHEAVKAS